MSKEEAMEIMRKLPNLISIIKGASSKEEAMENMSKLPEEQQVALMKEIM